MLLLKRTWPSGSTTWFARWTDPATGKQTDTNLTKLGLKNKAGRIDWCKRKSERLAIERQRHELGQEKDAAPKALEAAVAEFVEQKGNVLAESTLTAYRASLDLLLAWAADRGIRTTQELTLPRLADLREYLIGHRRRQARRRGRRGEMKTTRKKLRPASVNRWLRSIKTALGHWRKLGLTPHLDSDAIKDGLENLRDHRPLPEYLRPGQLRETIEAARRHDRESTARPVSAFLVFTLLSGTRCGESRSLRWEAVDLDAPGADGSPVGEIRLAPEETKTRHGRLIDLAVSPALRQLLAALRLQAGTAAYVFGGDRPVSADETKAALRRLRGTYAAPGGFTWQMLRSSCATYLTNAPGIFGAASAYRSAKQLGHSVDVSERRYAGLLRGIPREAHTLEDAMQIRDLVEAVAGELAAGDAIRARA